MMSKFFNIFSCFLRKIWHLLKMISAFVFFYISDNLFLTVIGLFLMAGALFLAWPGFIESLQRRGYLSSDELSLILTFDDESHKKGALLVTNISEHPIDKFSIYYLNVHGPSAPNRLDFPDDFIDLPPKKALPKGSMIDFEFNWNYPMSDFFISRIALRDENGIWVKLRISPHPILSIANPFIINNFLQNTGFATLSPFPLTVTTTLSYKPVQY